VPSATLPQPRRRPDRGSTVAAIPTPATVSADAPPLAAPSDPSATDRAALGMLAAWMGERYFRTFRLQLDDAAPFDAKLAQRQRSVGVSIATLWDPPERAAGAEELEELLTGDVQVDRSSGGAGAYAVWVPSGAELPDGEPARSELRLLLTRGLGGLAPGERREVRVPVTLQLAKIEDAGAYVSVTGGMSVLWTQMSEGLAGAFHLDSRPIHRLPEQEAEQAILISRVRDRAQLLNAGEVSHVALHDYWLLSRLPGEEPAGVTLVAAPPAFSPLDGPLTRRLFRRAVARATAQRAQGDCDLAVLLVVTSLAHIEDELVTAALRGMSPAGYGSLDLIALVADGQVRQVLQPRSLPW